MDRQRGVVLVMVLWLVVLLSLIAASYSRITRTEVGAMTQRVHQLKAKAIAEAAVQLVINDLLKSESERPWEAEQQTVSYGEGRVLISVQNTTGLVDLNTASPELLLRLLAVLDVADDAKIHLVDAIVDWRDKDGVRRSYGAEDSEYALQGLAYGAKDGPFNALSELQNVLGMDNDSYGKLAAHLTLFSQKNKINPQFASAELLRITTGLDEQAVADFVLQRWESNGADRSFLQGYGGIFSTAKGSIFKISGVAEVYGTKARIDATVLLVADQYKPYTLLSWRSNEWVTTVSQAR